MSEVLTRIKSRRSVRKFKPDMIPRDILEQIVTAGTYAPTGRNLQSPIILAVTNRELRDRISAMNAAVMGNLMLAAHELGIGSCWIHRAKEVFDSPEGKQILADLGIEGDYEGIGNCILGYVDGDYPEARERKENWIYWAE